MHKFNILNAISYLFLLYFHISCNSNEISKYRMNNENNIYSNSIKNKKNREIANKLLNVCEYCSKNEDISLRCSACKIVYYCDSNCQRKHWKKHKFNCQKIKKNKSLFFQKKNQKLFKYLIQGFIKENFNKKLSIDLFNLISAYYYNKYDFFDIKDVLIISNPICKKLSNNKSVYMISNENLNAFYKYIINNNSLLEITKKFEANKLYLHFDPSGKFVAIKPEDDSDLYIADLKKQKIIKTIENYSSYDACLLNYNKFILLSNKQRKIDSEKKLYIYELNPFKLLRSKILKIDSINFINKDVLLFEKKEFFTRIYNFSYYHIYKDIYKENVFNSDPRLLRNFFQNNILITQNTDHEVIKFDFSEINFHLNNKPSLKKLFQNVFASAMHRNNEDFAILKGNDQLEIWNLKNNKLLKSITLPPAQIKIGRYMYFDKEKIVIINNKFLSSSII